MNNRFVPILLLFLLCNPVHLRADDTSEKRLPGVVILATGGTIAGTGATSTTTVGYKAATVPVQALIEAVPELKKIANMAEVYYIHVAPHCAIGPVAFSASLQVDAVIPNFLIQEQVDAGLGAGLLREDWQVRDGHAKWWSLGVSPPRSTREHKRRGECTLNRSASSNAHIGLHGLANAARSNRAQATTV